MKGTEMNERNTDATAMEGEEGRMIEMDEVCGTT